MCFVWNVTNRQMYHFVIILFHWTKIEAFQVLLVTSSDIKDTSRGVSLQSPTRMVQRGPGPEAEKVSYQQMRLHSVVRSRLASPVCVRRACGPARSLRKPNLSETQAWSFAPRAFRFSSFGFIARAQPPHNSQLCKEHVYSFNTSAA